MVRVGKYIMRKVFTINCHLEECASTTKQSAMSFRGYCARHQQGGPEESHGIRTKRFFGCKFLSFRGRSPWNLKNFHPLNDGLLSMRSGKNFIIKTGSCISARPFDSCRVQFCLEISLRSQNFALHRKL